MFSEKVGGGARPDDGRREHSDATLSEDGHTASGHRIPGPHLQQPQSDPPLTWFM